MSLILFGLSMSILVPLVRAVFRSDGILSRGHTGGCLLATLLACIGLYHVASRPVDTAAFGAVAAPKDAFAAIAAAPPRPPIHAAPPSAQKAPQPLPPARSPDTFEDTIARISLLVVRSDFPGALAAHDALIARAGPMPENFVAIIETLALRRIKPIPAVQRQSNLEGYQFLAALRPDNQLYQDKVWRYSGP